MDEIEWTNTTQMDPTTTSGSVDNLEPGQVYELRVITFRTVTVPLRRKRALEDDDNVGISATVLYVTCPVGREGLNCENGKSGYAFCGHDFLT